MLRQKQICEPHVSTQEKVINAFMPSGEHESVYKISWQYISCCYYFSLYQSGLTSVAIFRSSMTTNVLRHHCPLFSTGRIH